MGSRPSKPPPQAESKPQNKESSGIQQQNDKKDDQQAGKQGDSTSQQSTNTARSDVAEKQGDSTSQQSTNTARSDVSTSSQPPVPQSEPVSISAVHEPEPTCSTPPKEPEQTTETRDSHQDIMGTDTTSENVSANTYKTAMKLPVCPSSQLPADLTCPRGSGNGKWPITCYAPLDIDVSVNAKHGGCASLVMISNAYGGAGTDTTCQIFLLRSGFDGNYFEHMNITKCHAGHFGAENSLVTDEDGCLIPSCMFGSNHVTIISNHPNHGTQNHGICIPGGEDKKVILPVNVNGNQAGSGHGGGCSLILCSSNDASALYMLRSGHKDNNLQKVIIQGEDKWDFNSNGDGILVVQGPEKSMYGVYHNRDNLCREENPACTEAATCHIGTPNGQDSLDLLKLGPKACASMFIILCSSSSGPENASAAAFYVVSISGSNLQCKYSHGLVGKSYRQKSADIWKFELSNNILKVIGPAGPCRYSVLSNLPHSDITYLGESGWCLATGEKIPVTGAVEITEDSVLGWLSERRDIHVKMDEQCIGTITSASLIDNEGKFAFHRSWSKEEKKTGLHLARVCYLPGSGKSMTHGTDIELEGSPRQLTFQPAGVVYALNSCGPAYQALNDVVYSSEFSQFANFNYDYGFGTRCTAFGGMKTHASHPAILTGTFDGFLYMTCRSTGVEATDEQSIKYKVPNLPNGNFTIRLHSVNKSASITANGNSLRDKVTAQLSKQKEVLAGYTAHAVDVPITIDNNSLSLHCADHMICGFALLDKTYKEIKPTAEELATEKEIKQKLLDEQQPLLRVLTHKALKITGWSPNLVSNSSGEAGDLSHWNISGDWKVCEGGYGTEKAFVTSHMRCVKYQEIDLTEQFSEEYLNSAPEIQVSEWYREGCIGGGFYSFKATLVAESGEVIGSYSTGEIGTLYRNNEWTQVKTTFKGYGPGVCFVTIESSGKDDKHWGGHYGPIMSTAEVRVKSESVSPDSDSYQDIVDLQNLEKQSSEFISRRDKLIVQVLAENQDMVSDLADHNVVPEVDPNFQKQTEVESKSKIRNKYKRKKREIRVFVSSTFRDFRQEREQLIKKTFREINNICSDRGVFFTYVDLRWGITEEQTSHGQTISICLNEIDRCRPYFICMMGHRFGWSQQFDTPDTLLNDSFNYASDNFPRSLGWVKDYRYDTSVTQLEIMHGVLNNIPVNKRRSFFYLRDSFTEKDFPPSELKVYLAESEWHHQKQTALRQRILEEDVTTKTYSSPPDVCELIKQDLTWCIDRDFPLGTELTVLEQEREAHLAFANARRRVYIGRDAYFNQIEEFMAGDSKQPLTILGESGSGKSSLVANWVSRVEEREPDTFVFFHFIGSSAKSVSYLRLLRRLYEELKDYFGLDLTVPSSDSHLVADLSTWLKMATTRSKCILVLDALNQLDDGSGTEGSEHDLQWIPKILPAGVKMVLSTLPGRALEAVKSAGWPVMKVDPLQSSEKLQILEGYLEGIYGKTLSQDQKSLIVDTPNTDNPLYLKALLDEVRIYGSFRSLTSKIQEYLLADSPGDLFALILERLEGDFEKGLHERPGLVRETTTAIWCSNRGMSEAELQDLLQVPSAVWSPFYLSLVENLVSRDGIVNFFHDHLRQAVETKYLSTPEAKKTCYLWLAEYFDKKTLSDRKVDELPSLLAKAEELDKLKETIVDLDVFYKLTDSEEGKFELIKFWNMLGGYKQMESAYNETLDNIDEEVKKTDKFLHIAEHMVDFYTELGLYSSARVMGEWLLSMYEQKYGQSDGAVIYHPTNQSRCYKCVHSQVIDLLTQLGSICYKQRLLPEAEEYYQDAISRLHRITKSTEKLQLTEALLGWATVKSYRDDMKESKKLLIRARELATDVLGPRHHYVAAIIYNLAQLSYKQGRLDEALGYLIQDLALTRGEVGTAHPRVAGILNEIALVYDDKAEQIAGPLFEAALVILLNTYGDSHLDVAVVRYNLGLFYFANNSFKKAKYQLEQALSIYSTFLGSDHPDSKSAQNVLDNI